MSFEKLIQQCSYFSTLVFRLVFLVLHRPVCRSYNYKPQTRTPTVGCCSVQFLLSLVPRVGIPWKSTLIFRQILVLGVDVLFTAVSDAQSGPFQKAQIRAWPECPKVMRSRSSHSTKSNPVLLRKETLTCNYSVSTQSALILQTP